MYLLFFKKTCKFLQGPEIFVVTLEGGGGSEHFFTYLGGGGMIRKKVEIFKFSPIPSPLINNERSLNETALAPYIVGFILDLSQRVSSLLMHFSGG